MKNDYTTFNLGIMFLFEHTCSLRAYEILKQRYDSREDETHSFSFDLSGLKKTLDIPEDFSLSVFRTIAREVSKYTEFIVTYSINCLGDTITFHVHVKDEIGVKYVE